MSPESSAPDPLAELVEGVRTGSPRAFDRLAREILPLVRRWALVRTGDPDDADDVAQRVLVRVHRGLPDFRGDARFTSWVYRITARTTADLHRSREARDRKRDALEREAAVESSTLDPSEAVEGRELTGLVRRFFRDLTGTQREVFDLVDLQGYRPAEAADLLEMNANTVRVHLHRARRTLRAALLEVDPDLAREYGT